MIEDSREVVRVIVDRTCPARFPVWVGEVFLPELQIVGPAEYDLMQIELWRHECQKPSDKKAPRLTKGKCSVLALYKQDEEEGSLKNCLNLRDGEEIVKKQRITFKKAFGRKGVILLKTKVRNAKNGKFYIPYVCISGYELAIRWLCVDDRCDKDILVGHLG